MMHWRQVVPTTCTLLAMLAGFFSLLLTVEGININNADSSLLFGWSAKMIMLSMILDGLDGNLARWLKGSSDFGAELDTYVDLTAFGIAPAVLIFAITMQNGDPLLRVLLPSCVALSGVVRLARFKVKDPLRGQGGYGGLPITANAGWVAMFVYLSHAAKDQGFSLESGPIAVVFLSGIFIFIVLQITNIRYPKPTKKVALFLPCVILVALLFWPNESIKVTVSIAMLVCGVGYIFIGPLFVKGVEVHRARKEAKSGGANGSDERA
jgi:CDP-diacylglycerol--serine O-phosphatidyltransferase